MFPLCLSFIGKCFFLFYSEAEPKGSDCYDAFKTMQDCMANYPGVYKQNLQDDEDAGGMDLGGMLDEEEEDPDKQSLKQEESVPSSSSSGSSEGHSSSPAGSSTVVAQKVN